MGNNQTKQKIDEDKLSPSEQFVVRSRMFRKKESPLLVGVSFTVTNGFLGVKRDIFLRLCRIITSLPGMRAMKDQSIRAIMGISQEQVAWKKHNHFAETRTQFNWPAANPTKDIADACVLADRYDQFDLPAINASVVFNDMLRMVDIVGAYCSLPAAAEAPCIALCGLLGAACAYIFSPLKEENALQQAVDASPLLALVRILVRNAKPTFYRRAGYVLIGLFYINGWTRAGVLLRSKDFLEMVGVVCAYTHMLYAHPDLPDTRAVVSAEIAAGFASPFTEYKVSFDWDHCIHCRLLNAALRVFKRCYPKGEVVGQLRAECEDSLAAVLVGLFGAPNAAVSEEAAECLTRLVVCGLRLQPIAKDVIAALERRLRMGLHTHTGLENFTAALAFRICERSGAGGDGNADMRNAMRGSEVIALALARLRETADGWPIVYTVRMLHTVLCTESEDNNRQTEGGDGKGRDASVLRCAAVFRANGAAEILQKTSERLERRTHARSSDFVDHVKEAVVTILEILARI